MPTLSGGDTLSLNKLSYSTNTTTSGTRATISGIVPGTPSAGDNIKFSEFAVDAAGSISGYTYGVEETSETYTLNMTGAGSRWATTLGAYSGNFYWAVDSGTTVTIQGSPTRTANITFSELGDNSTQTAINTVSANTISCYYFEDYNEHSAGTNGIGGDNTKTKTIYGVDSYDGNNQSLCLTADSPIEKADGTVVNIEDLQEGDTLKGFSINGLSENSDSDYYSFSSDTLGGSSKDVTVVNVTFSFAERYYSINGGQITATSEHPLFIKDSTDGLYKFKPVIGLEVGDKLIKGVNGELTEVDITSIDSTDGTIEVVSIDVEKQDTYMVNGYVTHNKGGDTFSDFDGPTAPTSVSYTHPDLSWSGGTADSDSNEGITAYDVQVNVNSDFSGAFAISETNWNATSMQLAGGHISPNTYYARVRNVQSGLKSDWTTIGGPSENNSITVVD